MNLKNLYKLIISIGASLSAGVIGSVFTTPAIPGWYAGLLKPALNPPNWIFGPVWTVLYILMGVAVYLVWSSYSKTGEEKEKKGIKVAIGLFVFQLFLNAAWSVVFFGFQNLELALFNIILLWIAIILVMFVFFKISRLAAYLLIPYILWVSFAIYLNYSIWVLN